MDSALQSSSHNITTTFTNSFSKIQFLHFFSNTQVAVPTKKEKQKKISHISLAIAVMIEIFSIFFLHSFLHWCCLEKVIEAF